MSVTASTDNQNESFSDRIYPEFGKLLSREQKTELPQGDSSLFRLTDTSSPLNQTANSSDFETSLLLFPSFCLNNTLCP